MPTRLVVVAALASLTVASVAGDEPGYHGKTLSQWLALVKDKDPTTRVEAARALVEITGRHRFGDEEAKAVAVAEPALRAALQDPGRRVRQYAARGLGHLGRDAAAAAPELAGLLKGDADWMVRRDAASALGHIGAATPDVVPALTATLKSDARDYVRAAAAQALAQIGPAPTVTPLLQQALADPDWVVRAVIAEQLAASDGANPAVVAALASMLKDPHDAVRARTAQSLAKIGAPGRAAAQALKELLGAPEADLRMNAAIALAKVGDVPGALPALIEALKSEDPVYRGWSAQVLGELGAAARGAVPRLKALATSDPVDYVRTKATKALETIGAR